MRDYGTEIIIESGHWSNDQFHPHNNHDVS